MASAMQMQVSLVCADDALGASHSLQVVAKKPANPIDALAMTGKEFSRIFSSTLNGFARSTHSPSLHGPPDHDSSWVRPTMLV